MNLKIYLGMLRKAEQTLAESFRQVAAGHAAEPDVHFLCHTLATQCEEHSRLLLPVVQRYGEDRSDNEPEQVVLKPSPDDLQDLYLLASLVDVTWAMVKQAGSALRDRELLDVVSRCDGETAVQLRWLQTRMKQAAPQALVVAR